MNQLQQERVKNAFERVQVKGGKKIIKKKNQTSSSFQLRRKIFTYCVCQKAQGT